MTIILSFKRLSMGNMHLTFFNQCGWKGLLFKENVLKFHHIPSLVYECNNDNEAYLLHLQTLKASPKLNLRGCVLSMAP